MKSPSESVKEYARGIVGGILFSLPLLYTMEVWEVVFQTSAAEYLLYMLFTFVLLIGYNHYAGIRKDHTWKEVVIDSIEEMGLGLMISFTLLLLLRKVNFAEMSVTEIIGRTVIEGMTIAIGVSVGTAQLGSNGEQDKNHKGHNASAPSNPALGRLGRSSIAFFGAFLIVSNIAPTEEIVILGLLVTPLYTVLLILLSLAISAVILFYSNFKGSISLGQKGRLYNIIFDLSLSYVLSLVASAFILWFWGRFDDSSFKTILSLTIIAGVPASLGASAGRLLLK